MKTNMYLKKTKLVERSASHVVTSFRLPPESLHKKPLEFPNSSYPAFSLPELLPLTLPSNQSVDVRVSLNRCHFTWLVLFLFIY